MCNCETAERIALEIEMMMIENWRRNAALATIVFFCAGIAAADVRLPHIFGSNMVLQQEQPIPVWGWAAAGEAVTVKLGETSASATADPTGRWRVTLPARKAGGQALTMTVKGNNTLTLTNVLMGEVWICSGQSNMQQGVGACDNAAGEIAAAKYPNIRLFMVPNIYAPEPTDDVDATWRTCSPETIASPGWGGFSGAAYFFGRKLHKDLGVPVGLIATSWGGTCIETWVPPVGYEMTPALAEIYQQVLLSNPKSIEHKTLLRKTIKEAEQWPQQARTAMEKNAFPPTMPVYPSQLGPIANLQSATAIYNAMIHPLIPYGIRGAIWYQGESNHGEGMSYYEKKKALIGGWRKLWGQGDFPFFFVQIAPYTYGNEEPHVMPQFWEVQTACLKIPNTGMVVTNDITMLNDIHPRNKQDVGKRLALLALAKTYGRKDVVCEGPMFKSMKIEGDTIRVSFTGRGSGLASRDGKPLTHFEIIGENGFYTPAKAEIDPKTNTVLVSSPKAPNPGAVRFAWHKTAEPNLINKEGLPANSFRAGTPPKVDLLSKNVPEAKDYEVLLELDLKNLGRPAKYDVDRRTEFKGKFDRIAYFLQICKPEDGVKYVYVSMDAFTDDLGKIGIPDDANSVFQQKIQNMTVISNVEGIKTGQNLPGGNIEFWPHNYGPQNSISIPDASPTVFDFGDGYGAPVAGYGSMQVHNYAAKQTVFAINNWAAGNNADIGIGNSTGNTMDWTFTAAGNQYAGKVLKVLVRRKK
jgi:sialate O-acetylesterase